MVSNQNEACFFLEYAMRGIKGGGLLSGLHYVQVIVTFEKMQSSLRLAILRQKPLASNNILGPKKRKQNPHNMVIILHFLITDALPE